MPRDNRLFTLALALAVCLHTVRLHVCMLWLTMVLQKPATARRAIAVELLRRSDQMDNHRRRAQSIPAPRLCFEHSAACSQQLIQTRPRSKTHGPSAAATNGRVQKPRQAASKAFAAGLLAALDTLDNAFRQAKLDSDDTCQSTTTMEQTPAILTRLHINQKASIITSAENTRELYPCPSQAGCKDEESSIIVNTHFTPPVSPTIARPDISCGATPTPEERAQTRLQTRLRFPYTPPLSDIDTTGYDNARVEWKLRSDTNVHLKDDTTEGAREDLVISPRHTSMAALRVLAGTGESRSQKRWSACSMESTSSTVRRSSPATLRSRGKTNGGLLEFKATTTGPKQPLPHRKHRRILSLNLPIRPNISQPSTAPQTPAQPSTFAASPPQSSDDEASIAIQLDAELQYKQRHIFIGTASLHSFLDILEPAPAATATTTKPAIMKAFTTLASKEQLLARRTSQNPQDWTLVTRIQADTSQFDYLALARTQLGSISLQHFIDSVPFNAADEAPLVAVVEAFKIASHMDAWESRNTGSRARAVRALLVSRST